MSADAVDELAHAIETGAALSTKTLQKYWEGSAAPPPTPGSSGRQHDLVDEIKINSHQERMRASRAPWKVKKNVVTGTAQFEFGMRQPTIQPSYVPHHAALNKRKKKMGRSVPIAPPPLAPAVTDGSTEATAAVTMVVSHAASPTTMQTALRALMLVLGVHLAKPKLAYQVAWGNAAAYAAYRRQVVTSLRLTKFVPLECMERAWFSNASPRYAALTSFTALDASALSENTAATLGACGTLRSLELHRNDLLTSPALARALASLHSLQRLVLENFAQLRSLDFLRALRRPSALLSLSLRSCQNLCNTVSRAETTLPSLFAPFLSLLALELTACTALDSSVLTEVAHSCPRIRGLDLTGCDWLTDADFATLRSMQSLEVLTLPAPSVECGRTAEGLLFLTYVDRSTIAYLMETAMQAGSSALPPTVQFYLHHVLAQRRFTLHPTLDALASGRPSLSYLTKIDCSVSAAAAAATTPKSAPILDLLAFESCTALRDLLLDGCRLAVSYADVDAAYHESVVVAAREGSGGGGGGASQQQRVVEYFLPEVVRSSGCEAVWKRHLTAHTVSLARCSLVSTRPRLLRDRQRPDARGLPVHWDSTTGDELTSDPVRRAVVAEYKFLFLKHLASSAHLASHSVPRPTYAAEKGSPLEIPTTEKEYGACFGAFTLTLSDSPFVDAASLAYLATWLAPSLTSLNIARCPGVTDEALLALATTLLALYRSDPIVTASPSRLQSLSLAGCTNITNEGVRTLCTLLQDSLVELDLSGCAQLTNSSLRSLPVGLRTLDLSRCASMGSAALEHAAERCGTSLTKLFLDGCDFVLDDVLRHRISAFSALTHLSLRGCTRLHDAALTLWFGSLPPSRPFVFLNVRETEGISRKTVAYLLHTASQRSLPVEILY
jgi:hypothetical protein